MISVGRHQLHLGDCLYVLNDLQEASVDAVVTSPPYNLDVDYGSYKDRLPQAAYLAQMSDVARKLERVVKDDGHLFLNMGSSCREPWMAADVAHQFRKNGWVLQNHIIWAKSVTVDDKSFGQFKPVQSKRFLNHVHETIYHFTKDGKQPVNRLAAGVPFAVKSNIARCGHADDRRCAGDVWFIPYQPIQTRAEKFDHPAGFPVELPRRCLKLTGKTGVVLDPFVGAGTTLVAAEELGWCGIGIDLDPVYLAQAEKRLTAHLDVQILDVA